ncbi:phosphoribosylformylglycinamidine cyclo-ligase [Silvanigrella paludirubra]|uniref:Phosphoribosylformylglycinamidine cyclo-ligase n=1 Tax=Silvanigrella paludirubra TaxID=2499159 RepID=A0A6N6VQW3_9BACT|nr:phosphoribosylformylglycinamidine cyclo-ligase [Silvanigrella paludirubra]KAB8036481.1 phosphoribosylformylglycinamidine cyclo-ligase [Silvanigrella paludirubra]
MSSATYEKAGVSIQAGETLVEKIKKINPTIGGFAGIYELDSERSLVACTDGVGTKLELGIKMQRYEDLGQDLVAMSVNDLIVCGAKPLFFLDYFATGKLDVDVAHRVIKGIVKACQDSGCLLLGGETAEMPGFYDQNKFDLAGFAVGDVLNKDIIDGKNIKENDIIVGLPSSGFHSNGYSLVRKIMTDNNVTLETPFEGKTIGDYLTEPTRLYVKDILNLKKHIVIKGMAHITGGGLTNISRILPENFVFDIDKKKIPVPAIIKHFQTIGKISDEEAFTVWNMGMGFTLIIDPSQLENLKKIMPDCFEIGKVISLNKK